MTDEVFGPRYAATYDAVYADKDYAAECDLLEEVFDSHADRAVRSVLDLGCGTGRHAVELAQRGYDVTGVDRSEAMLARARQRASDADVEVGFELGDLRETRLGSRFDAVIMMFAVLGYQLTDQDVTDAFRTASAHLQPGGVLVFDFWYGPAVEAIGTEKRQREVRAKGQKWLRTSHGERRRDAPLVDIKIEFDPMGPGAPIRETHTVRYFGPPELEQLLRAADLSLERLRPIDSPDGRPDPTTWNVVGTAKPATGDHRGHRMGDGRWTG